jgi:hypothetical protein
MISAMNRFAHDAYAQLAATFGCSAKHSKQTNSSYNLQPLTKYGETLFCNHLERLFYGQSTTPYIVSHPNTQIASLSNCYIVGFQLFVYNSELQYCRLDESHEHLSLKHVRKPIPFFCRKILQPLLFLGSRYTDNHYHFIFEHLPLIQAAITKINFNKGHILMVTNGQKQWQSEYLVRLGIEPNQIVESSFGTTWSSEAYVVPNLSMCDRSLPFPPESYKTLVTAMLPVRNKSDEKVQLFTSRNDASRRRLLNEHEMFKVALKYYPNLQKVTLSKLGLSEQLDLFDKCEVLIGPVGQAFRNVLFCRNALCVELIPGRDAQDNAFAPWIPSSRYLAHLHGNSYLPLYSGIQPDGPNSDWWFPVDKFEQSLQKVKTLIASSSCE